MSQLKNVQNVKTIHWNLSFTNKKVERMDYTYTVDPVSIKYKKFMIPKIEKKKRLLFKKLW